MDLVLPSIHILQLGIIISALALWKSYPKATIYKWIILITTIALISSIIILKGNVLNMLLHLSIDLILISFISFFLNQIETSYFKILFLFAILALLPAIHKKTTQVIPLDKNQANTGFHPEAELLVEINDLESLSRIKSKYREQIISIKNAFEVEEYDITTLDNYYLVDLDNKVDLFEFAQELKTQPSITWAEPNQRIEIPKTTTEVIDKVSKISLGDPLIDQQWAFKTYNLESFHKKVLKNKDITSPATVAILDTGVDGLHEDLAMSYSSINKEYDTDSQGHGTHCAGIAASVSNNGIGVASLAPAPGFINIMGIKVLNTFGFGFQSTIIQGIIEAIDNGADVISLSLGTVTSEDREKSYSDVLEYANNHNVIVIAAAGNSSQDAALHSPANTPGVIAVGALDPAYNVANFSNTIESLEMGIYAPGQSIMSTLPSNKYGIKSGTSMATPFVAGLAGIAKTINKGITTEEFYSLLSTGYQLQKSKKISDPNKVLDNVLNMSKKTTPAKLGKQ